MRLSLLLVCGFERIMAEEPISSGALIQFNGEATAHISYGNEIYVAVQRTNIFTSCDKTHWKAYEPGPIGRLYDVAFGNGRFVAVGNEGLVMMSPDGRLWCIDESGTDDRLRGITYGNRIFVAVGYVGTIITSRDGQNWVSQKSDTETRLQSVAYGDGHFVAVGWNRTVLTSTNGTKWTSENVGVERDFVRVAYIDGVFLAVIRHSGEDTNHSQAELKFGKAGITRR